MKFIHKFENENDLKYKTVADFEEFYQRNFENILTKHKSVFGHFLMFFTSV